VSLCRSQPYGVSHPQFFQLSILPGSFPPGERRNCAQQRDEAGQFFLSIFTESSHMGVSNSQMHKRHTEVYKKVRRLLSDASPPPFLGYRDVKRAVSAAAVNRFTSPAAQAPRRHRVRTIARSLCNLSCRSVRLKAEMLQSLRPATPSKD
jgi:hypothetical protein